MSHQYRFKRGNRVRIVSGKHAGATDIVDSKVFQYSADYSEELGAAYHVVLDAGKRVTVRVEQAEGVNRTESTSSSHVSLIEPY